MSELSLTNRVEMALKRDARFSNVDHERPQISQDENGYSANVLAFIYREQPYHAHIDEAGIQVTRPGGGFSRRDRPVGKPIRPEDAQLADVIAKTIDEAKLE